MKNNIIPVRTKKGNWRFRDTNTGEWIENPGVDMSAINYQMSDSITGELRTDTTFQYTGETAYNLSSEVFKGLFEETITEQSLEDMYRRDELAHAGINKVARSIFDRFVHIHAFFRNGKINQKLEDDIQELNEKYDLKNVMRQAWIVKQIKGVALISLGLPGAADTKATKGPLGYISFIPSSRINRFEINLDASDSENYGKISKAEIFKARAIGSGQQGIFATEVIIDQPMVLDASRFIHWHYPDLEGLNPMGMPGWLPLADLLTVKKNIDYATGEALWQFATRKYILIASPFTTETDWNAIKNDWKNFKSTTNFAVRGEGIDVKEFGGEGQLDPKPYYDWFADNMGPAIGISRTHLVNSGASGAGAVEARRNFERDINSFQLSDIEPILRELYNRLMDLGVLSSGKLEFDWHPLTQLSEEEDAFIKSRHGLGRNLEMSAIERAFNVGLATELDDDGRIVRHFKPLDKDEEEHKKDEHILLPSEEPEPSPSPTRAPGEPENQPPERPKEPDEMEDMVREILKELLEKRVPTDAPEE